MKDSKSLFGGMHRSDWQWQSMSEGFGEMIVRIS